ncbi:hypothetical protein AAMO2058_000914200 [Amorphochlora amoebiformis]
MRALSRSPKSPIWFVATVCCAVGCISLVGFASSRILQLSTSIRGKVSIPSFSMAGRRCTPRRSLSVDATTSSNDFKNGMNLEVDGIPFKVTEFLHVKPGKGSAFVRTKLKNLLSGNSVEKTFRAGETVGLADVYKQDVQYTYKDGSDFVFMNMETFDEMRVGPDEMGDQWQWMKEGETIAVVTYNGKIIDVELPKTVSLKITQSDIGVKGNTASGGATKPATLETGATIQVPIFIKEGESIKLDTRTGEYLSRDNTA